MVPEFKDKRNYRGRKQETRKALLRYEYHSYCESMSLAGKDWIVFGQAVSLTRTWD